MRQTHLFCATLALACQMTGCSTKAWYEGIQASAASECERKATSERDACVAQLNKLSYDRYEKERRK